MSQPITCVWALLLLLRVTVAEAQLQAERGRSITLAAHPSEPIPKLRVAAGRKTAIVLDAPIEKGSVQVDLTRVRLVHVGEHSLIIEPVVTPGKNERWVLRVRYADGGSPEWAVFVLVSHPDEVDLHIEVIRQRQTLEPRQAEQPQASCAGPRAEVWVLADRLRGGSVQSIAVRHALARGWAYRFEDGLLLAVEVKLGAGQQRWVPTGATLRASADSSEEVKVHALHVREGPLAPGEWSPVAVEAALPSPAAGQSFTLELRGAGGQSLTIKDMRIPLEPREQGSGR